MTARWLAHHVTGRINLSFVGVLNYTALGFIHYPANTMCPFFKRMRRSNAAIACSCLPMCPATTYFKRVPRTKISSYVIIFIEGLPRTYQPSYGNSMRQTHAAIANIQHCRILKLTCILPRAKADIHSKGCGNRIRQPDTCNSCRTVSPKNTRSWYTTHNKILS